MENKEIKIHRFQTDIEDYLNNYEDKSKYEGCIFYKKESLEYENEDNQLDLFWSKRIVGTVKILLLHLILYSLSALKQSAYKSTTKS